MKVYAKQVDPEWQESPLFIEGCFPDNIILDGNREYKSHTTSEYMQIIRYFDEMATEWENQNFYYEWTGEKYIKHKKRPDYTIAEILRDYGFFRSDEKIWSNKQKHKWRMLMEDEKSGDDEKVILSGLELLTGHKWENATIRGYCQSDWQNIYYRVDEWTSKDLEIFEIEYFNTGTEWIIHDATEPPAKPEDISGYTMYCTSWNNEGIRDEIAKENGVSSEDVIMYVFDGYAHIPKYVEVV